MRKICNACNGKGYRMMPLIKTRLDCPACDGVGYTRNDESPEEIEKNVLSSVEFDCSEILELVEKHYGSGKAMQVADMLRGE